MKYIKKGLYMNITTQFREQHTEMLTIAGEILARLSPQPLSQDAGEVRALLSQLLGKLTVHLAMEDKSLYPHLLEHQDENIKSLSAHYVDEMGNISMSVQEYKTRWPSKTAIERNPSEFIAETKGILTALEQRIKKENNELYKLVEAL